MQIVIDLNNKISKQTLGDIVWIAFTYYRHQTSGQNTLLHNMAMKFRRHKLLPFGDNITCTEKEGRGRKLCNSL